MGQRPRSGDIPWLPAHSILKWIGGDISMLDPLGRMSSANSEHNFGKIAATHESPRLKKAFGPIQVT
jgi:hypothetical protein